MIETVDSIRRLVEEMLARRLGEGCGLVEAYYDPGQAVYVLRATVDVEMFGLVMVENTYSRRYLEIKFSTGNSKFRQMEFASLLLYDLFDKLGRFDDDVWETIARGGAGLVSAARTLHDDGLSVADAVRAASWLM